MNPIAFRALGSARQLDFLPQACLSLRLAQRICLRCVAACPIGALKLDNGSMALDERCMGCGRCVPACPSGALRARDFEFAPSVADDEIVLECWKAAPRAGQQNSIQVPCLGGISRLALLELVAAAQGRPVRLMDKGWCADCAAGGGENHPAAAVVAEVGRLLEKLGAPLTWRPKIVSRPLPIGLMPDDIPDPLSQKTLSRRGFFSTFLSEAAATVASAAGGTGKVDAAPRTLSLAKIAGREAKRTTALILELAQRAGTEPSAALFPAVEIGVACCNHGICAAACPGGALRRYEDEATGGIMFNPTACLACGVCETVCPEHAVRLLPEGNPEHTIHPVKLTQMSQYTCSACGEKFAEASETLICPDCTKKREIAASLFGISFADRQVTAANLEL